MRVGIIKLDQEILLRFLDYYPEGRITDIRLDNLVVGGLIHIQIEHPDMPEVAVGECIQVVYPLYVTHQDAMGNKVTMRIKRDEAENI